MIFLTGRTNHYNL